ncbi:MAG: NmrA/HSCARG family protein [Nitrospira sp.]|nr:NmrA/HSCARG family protein [Candidatus Manganitrophaceae bacterium]HIL34159.1 NmrA/HSCARG family protein [Candidatus Manganitrophaceae bacterium]
METNGTILVTGATGQQGNAIATSLLGQGKNVRSLTRHLSKGEALKRMGSEVVEGELTDQASLEKALEGIKQVFLVTTPFEAGMDAEVKQGLTMVDAAKAAGVDHLVYSSVGGADQKTGIPHFETKWQVEEYIKKVGIPATILRPVFFMENFGSPWMLPAIQNKKLTFPVRPDRTLQMVSLRDIGAFGAAAFIRPQDFIGQTIELAGDEMTLPDALKMVSQSIGHTIEYELLPDEQAEAALGHDFAVMFRWFNEVGYNANISALERQWGIPLTKFKEVVDKASWAKTD